MMLQNYYEPTIKTSLFGYFCFEKNMVVDRSKPS